MFQSTEHSDPLEISSILLFASINHPSQGIQPKPCGWILHQNADGQKLEGTLEDISVASAFANVWIVFCFSGWWLLLWRNWWWLASWQKHTLHWSKKAVSHILKKLRRVLWYQIAYSSPCKLIWTADCRTNCTNTTNTWNLIPCKHLVHCKHAHTRKDTTVTFSVQ